jgi:hypothetical protein
LVDDKGRERGALYATDAVSSLSLSAGEGERGTVAWLTAWSTGIAQLSLSGANDPIYSGVSLEGLSGGSGFLRINGVKDRVAAGGLTLGVTRDGEAGLDLAARDKTLRASFRIDSDGLPALRLRDERQKTRAALGHIDLEDPQSGSVEKRSAASMVLFNKEGKIMWRAP